MYFDDHPPPHFHVRYNEFRAAMRIEDLSLREGDLPPRVHALVLEWARLHRAEPQTNWENLRRDGIWQKIEPLV